MHSVDQIDTDNDISGHIYCTEPDDLLKIWNIMLKYQS